MQYMCSTQNTHMIGILVHEQAQTHLPTNASTAAATTPQTWICMQVVGNHHPTSIIHNRALSATVPAHKRLHCCCHQLWVCLQQQPYTAWQPGSHALLLLRCSLRVASKPRQNGRLNPTIE
jgi:hypothetical protein